MGYNQNTMKFSEEQKKAHRAIAKAIFELDVAVPSFAGHSNLGSSSEVVAHYDVSRPAIWGVGGHVPEEEETWECDACGKVNRVDQLACGASEWDGCGGAKPDRVACKEKRVTTHYNISVEAPSFGITAQEATDAILSLFR